MIYGIGALYLLVVNLVSYATMGEDKLRAQKGEWRVKESNIWTLAFIGGSVGSWLGMRHFRHKTKKLLFKLGLPTLILLQSLALFILLF